MSEPIKAEVGDIVEVTGNKSAHMFPIGSRVTAIEVSRYEQARCFEGHDLAGNPKGQWWMAPSEYQIICLADGTKV